MRLLLGIEVDAVSKPIRAIREVMWVVQAGYQDTYRLGIEFLEVDESQRERLRQLVADRAKVDEDHL
jgi:c-di-GMP-binding flagellar brake protein YcgR